jgi:hypothetical protein
MQVAATVVSSATSWRNTAALARDRCHSGDSQYHPLGSSCALGSGGLMSGPVGRRG